jgi:predicted ATPase
MARMLLARQDRQRNPFTMLYNLLSTTTAPGSNTLIHRGRDGVHGQVMSLMAGMLILLASHHPVMMVVEDIQWSDPVTLDFLSFMERNLAGHRLFTVLTSRRKYRMNLRQSGYLTRLRLACLDRQQSTILIRSLLGSEPLPTGFENALYRKCGGVPLYLEAYCQQILNRSHASADSFCNSRITPVPESLQDAINARLDMLGQARKLVLLISVLGSIFNHPTISALAALNGIDADQCLNKLLRERLIKVVADKPDTSYVFLEPLLLDAACQSLLRETRHRYQQQVADLGIAVNHGIRESPSLLKVTRPREQAFTP